MKQVLKINHIPDVLQAVDSQRDIWYMATVAPGMEEIAASELLSKVSGATLLGKMRGKIFFMSPEFNSHALRCVDNIYEYLYFGSIGRTRNDFMVFRVQLESQRFRNIVRSIREKYGEEIFFTANASIVGKHSFSRFEVAAQFSKVMAEHYRFNISDSKGRGKTVELRIDVLDENFLLSIKLTDATFRFRGTGRIFSRGAIRPTIAHCLVWLSNPSDSEVFMDPFCGSGTILCEREIYPYGELIGNDLSMNEISNTKANLRNRIRLMNDDVLNLNFDSNYIDTIVSNPPWDKQIKVDDATVLYTAFLERFSGYLKKDGKTILLTGLEESLKYAANRNNLRCEGVCTVSLHGTLCGVYILKN